MFFTAVQLSRASLPGLVLVIVSECKSVIFQSSKIISVLVSIKFELNHFSISFYTVSELFSVLVSSILEIISVQFHFQYLHHFSKSFVIDNIRTQSSAN